MTDQRQTDQPRHAVKRAADQDTKRDRARNDEPLSAAQARRVIDRVVVAEDRPETPPAQDATALLLRRAIYVFAALIALGVIVFAALAIYTLSTGADVAELASTGAVGANREKAVAELRSPADGHVCSPGIPELAPDLNLECANRALVAAGVAPVPDPGAGVTPSQMAAVLARALDRLDDAGAAGASSGEEPQPGVNSPPTSGRFRGPR